MSSFSSNLELCLLYLCKTYEWYTVFDMEYRLKYMYYSNAGVVLGTLSIITNDQNQGLGGHRHQDPRTFTSAFTKTSL